MNVSLTPQLEKVVSDKVSSGLYNSASEVIRQALRLMIQLEEKQDEKLKSLQNATNEGLESGAPTKWNPDEIKKKARARQTH